MSDDTSRAAPDRRQIVDLDFVQGLIAAVDESGIDSLEISRGGTRIRIAKTPSPGNVAVSHTHAAPQSARETAPAAPAQPAVNPGGESAALPPAPRAGPGLTEVKSPMVGTFYRSATPDAPSYVEVGSRVVRGQTLCILEAMKLMNELQAEVGGIIREVCAENAEPIEYGQVLFRIEPEA